VVEGVGDHACEYMTGGVVAVLGRTGYNFGAGMSGGVAYVFDRSEQFQNRCNMDSVDMESVWRPEDVQLLHRLLADHERHTGSSLAAEFLRDWREAVPLFLKVSPVGQQRSLERMKQGEGDRVERLAATEEVYAPACAKRTA
jgi:glutamate synthase domain-containing protein 3